ncbi:MAG TPA: hypothetical protein VNZ86_13960 [Bacteroidia bacterium]|nr:hypothetical protein [Bacteroidia bacterium]
MNFKLVTEYPPAFIIFCLLAGAAYAVALYYREKQFTDTPLWIRRLMAALRFVSVTCIAFLLLNPLLKTTFREVEKPVIVLAQDNSESIVIGKDSAFYRTEYKKNLAKLEDALSAKFDVRLYTFGESVKEIAGTDVAADKINYKEKETDLSSLFDEMETRYSNRNLGAIIIASDGIYNQGANPVFSTSRLKAPFFTIALGDTTIKRDLIISKVIHNRLAYLGNKFPAEVVIDAKRCKGTSSVLTITKGENTLFTQKINIPSDAYNITIPVQLDAKEPGMQHYRARLSAVEGELSTVNNVQDFFVEIMDSREKVLILADAPHPDVAALKQAIENNQNYEVDAYPLKDFDKKIAGYNLIILDQLPSMNQTSKVINDIISSDVPVLFLVGSQTNIRNFNALQLGLQINGQGQRFNEPQPVLEDHFPLFTLSEAARQYIPKLPALACPFGSYKASTSCFPLFYQEIGIVKTKDPLFLFNQIGNKKVGIIAGEGIWRWRLQDFEDHNTQDIFNELIDKTVQYLSVKLDKSQFRIVCKNNFPETQPVEMEAEVYNESYELINDPEVNLEIENAEGHKYPFTFTKTGNAYRLNAGMFPPGEYKFKAHTRIGDKVMNQNGTFSISPLVLEAINTTADHQLLYNLARKHNGEMVYPSQMEELANKILTREDIRPIVYNPKKLLDLIELKWIFFILLLLLSAEWMMRKRNGGY